MRWALVLACGGCTALFGLHSAGESDRDGDRVPDVVDNCPDLYNPDQSDFDHDGIGDACSGSCFAPGAPDSDGDGIPDPCDGCDNRLPDDNHDGVPDACEHLDAGIGPAVDAAPADAAPALHDEDGDKYPDISDFCPANFAALNLDSNGDGVGDDCSIGSPPDRQFF